MILWINGAFGSGKTTAAYEIHRRVKDSIIYDPENAGYFIRKNSPPYFSKGDFQDIPLWREINYKMLKLISSRYSGLIIVPMTLVNVDYYNEIVTKLINDGIKLEHFILYASRETILKRLKIRGFGRIDNFGEQAVDRCLYSFDTYIKETKIMTDNKSIDDVVAEIAAKSKIPLLPDNRTKVKKLMDKYITFVKHIR